MKGLILLVLLVAIATVSVHASGQNFNHVVIIPFENIDYKYIVGSTATADPFIQTIEVAGSSVDMMGYDWPSYSGGCSTECYTFFTSGNGYGTNGTNVVAGGVNENNLFNEAANSGLSWVSYCENHCPRGPDHAPCLQYTDTNQSSQCVKLSGSLISNTATIGASTANIVWLTPDDTDNMHSSNVTIGDRWLQSFLVGSGNLTNPSSGSLLATPLFALSAQTLLLLWWDEPCNGTACPSDNTPGPFGKSDKAEVYYMPGTVKANYVTASRPSPAQYIDTQSLLMIQNNWGLACLSLSCSTSPLAEIFNSGTVGGLVVPTPVLVWTTATSVLIGSGLAAFGTVYLLRRKRSR